MTTKLTVTAKGQVTLRRALLNHLGVVPGGQLVFDLLPGQRVEIRPPERDLRAFFGCLPAHGRSVSIEDMGRVIEDGWAGADADHA